MKGFIFTIIAVAVLLLIIFSPIIGLHMLDKFLFG